MHRTHCSSTYNKKKKGLLLIRTFTEEEKKNIGQRRIRSSKDSESIWSGDHKEIVIIKSGVKREKRNVDCNNQEVRRAEV